MANNGNKKWQTDEETTNTSRSNPGSGSPYNTDGSDSNSPSGNNNSDGNTYDTSPDDGYDTNPNSNGDSSQSPTNNAGDNNGASGGSPAGAGAGQGGDGSDGGQGSPYNTSPDDGQGEEGADDSQEDPEGEGLDEDGADTDTDGENADDDASTEDDGSEGDDADADDSSPDTDESEGDGESDSEGDSGTDTQADAGGPVDGQDLSDATQGEGAEGSDSQEDGDSDTDESDDTDDSDDSDDSEDDGSDAEADDADSAEGDDDGGGDNGSYDAPDESSTDDITPDENDTSSPGIDKEPGTEDNMLTSSINPEIDDMNAMARFFAETRDGDALDGSNMDPLSVSDAEGTDDTGDGSISGGSGETEGETEEEEAEEEEEEEEEKEDDEEGGIFAKALGAKATGMKWAIGGAIALISLVFVFLILAISAVTTVIQEEDEVASSGGGNSDGMVATFSNHRLSAEVLALEDEVADAMSQHGLDDMWLMVILGVIQQESGGLLDDVMQSSESKGLPVNTLGHEESIYYGVLAFKNAVDAAKSRNIVDVRAILQGYNMNHAFIHRMAENGETHWTSDYAEQYSINVVFPAVTRKPASQAKQEASNSPWATKIGKPYYIRNGGDFHYPNAVMHHLGVDYSTDGAIVLEDIGQSLLTEGSLDGYGYPIPLDKLQITSNYGYQEWRGRVHHGLDLQYKGALWHQNEPLYAVAEGKVIVSGYASSQGNYVTLLHGPPGDNDIGLDPDAEITTVYMHMYNLPVVKTGEMVKAGQLLGYEGNTGASQGDHLHFEIRQFGESIDPRLVLRFPPSVS